MYIDIGVVVNESVTIDACHSYVVSYSLFYSGILVTHTMTARELEIAALVAFLNGLLDRSSASEMFRKTERITLDNKRRELTLVACGKMVLVVILGLFRTEESAEVVGFDPHYVQRSWKILQIIKRLKHGKAIKAELEKITVKPIIRTLEGQSRPSSAQRRSLNSADATPVSNRSGMTFSIEKDVGLAPITLEGSQLQIYHFAVEDELGMIFSSQSHGTEDHFRSVYQNIYLTYAKLKPFTKKFTEVAFHTEFKSVTDPFSKVKLWVTARKMQRSVVFVCYDSGLPTNMFDLAYQLSLTS
mmetsp:Transcript_10938/g.21382  ORF Transcript_10938/g.21382 Transcript_10938/m.21382 type:complete len:300 (-) Transcript_10938:1855-2754(-)